MWGIVFQKTLVIIINLSKFMNCKNGQSVIT